MFRKIRISHIALLTVLALTLSGCFGLFTVPDPTFVVTGVEDDKEYGAPVTPKITPGKGTTLTITLNEEAFTSGTTISEPGSYVLDIVGKNKKGDEIVETYSFTINAFPVIQITGIEDGGQYLVGIAPTVTTMVTDDDLTITLNDTEFTSGTSIDEPGEYTLKADAINGLGEEASAEYTFMVYNGVRLAINEAKTGFGFDKATSLDVNTDSEYIKYGERSLKFVNQAGTKSAFRVQRDPHPDWPADWTDYNRLSVWAYIVDVSELQDTAIEFVQATPAGEKKKAWAKSELSDGWNYIEVNIPELAGDDYTQLVGMDAAPSNKGTYFLDIIIRTPADPGNTATIYFDEFIFWEPLP